MSHVLAGARGAVEDPEAVLRTTQAWAESRSSDVLLAEAGVVFGRDHLESAALHAERARAAGRMATRSISMEALLYLSGRRQVADAIAAAGLRVGSTTIAVVVFGDARPDDLLTRLGWVRDDSVLAAEGKPLAGLGLARGEARTVPRGAEADLALERTALLDLEK